MSVTAGLGDDRVVAQVGVEPVNQTGGDQWGGVCRIQARRRHSSGETIVSPAWMRDDGLSPWVGMRRKAAVEEVAGVDGPMVYLLVGLTGSGKTTYAQRVLEPAAAVRLSVDEEVFARHGRYGVDYPEFEYFDREAPVVVWARERLVELVREGRDVVVDHRLWRRADREDWKKLVESAGGRWRLLFFPVPREELLRRLGERNRQGHANALLVTESALDDFYARFDEPSGEGEQVIAVGSF
jgi:predicted kinase